MFLYGMFGVQRVSLQCEPLSEICCLESAVCSMLALFTNVSTFGRCFFSDIRVFPQWCSSPRYIYFLRFL